MPYFEAQPALATALGAEMSPAGHQKPASALPVLVFMPWDEESPETHSLYTAVFAPKNTSLNRNELE